jgi:hypothetical protein
MLPVPTERARRVTTMAVVAAATATLGVGCAELAGVDAWNGASAAIGSTAGSTGSGSGGATGTGGTGGGSTSRSGGGGGGGGVGGQELGYRATVLGDSPVGYWRFGEAAGSTAHDETGSHDGLYGIVTLGEEGAVQDGDTAAGFDPGDGLSGSVIIADVFDFASTDHFSLEAWIRPDSLGPTYRHIVDKVATVDGNREGYVLYAFSDDIWFERCAAGSTDTVKYGPLSAGVFTYVVATYDGAVLRLFVNGALGAANPAVNHLSGNDEMLVFGANGAEYQEFDGVLDEVAVYDEALGDAQVSAHYRAALGQ